MKKLIISTFLILSVISQGLLFSQESICSPKECYLITKVLGEGAFGKVYEVQNEKGEKLALKAYKDTQIQGFEKYNDLEREFQRGQELDHPNIIKSLDYFTQNSQNGEKLNYLLLDYIDGKTVWATERKSYDGDLAMVYGSQLFEALKYAYTKGLIHGDAHSGNFMISNNLGLMVIDLASFHTFDELIKPELWQQQSSDKESQLSKYIRENKISQEVFEKYKQLYVTHYYLKVLSDLSLDLISKSDLTREQKFELMTAIKKIEWNVIEDREDGQLEDSMEKYFDDFLQVFYTFI